MIASDPVNKRGRCSLFFVVLRGMANQRQERFLNDIGGGFRTSHSYERHMEKAAPDGGGNTQKCVLVTGGEAPHQFNISRFCQVCHLYRVGRMPTDYSNNYFRPVAKFHYIVIK